MAELPPQVNVDLGQDLRSYWRERMRQHTGDSYASVPMSKLPEDLRTYEHLIWSDRPDTVIEIGTQYGGSALWFRDRLRTLRCYGLIGEPRVVTIDIDQARARTELRQADPDYANSIHVLEGDVRDDAIAKQVGELIGKRCFVIEDSAHEYETTLAALTSFAGLVPVGGYFVVEDGSVDVETLRIAEAWPRGVLPALRDWLSTTQGRQFEVRRDLEVYGITSHPNGFLQRVREDGAASNPEGDHDAAGPHPLELAPVGVDTLAERQLAEATDRIADLEARLVEREAANARHISELDQALREARMATDSSRAENRALSERLTFQDRVLSDVFDSLSWRVTKPLRAVKRTTRRS